MAHEGEYGSEELLLFLLCAGGRGGKGLAISMLPRGRGYFVNGGRVCSMNLEGEWSGMWRLENC